MTGPILILVGLLAFEIALRDGLRPLHLLGQAAGGQVKLK